MRYKLQYLRVKLISLLLGFFLATVLSTMPAQTGDSSIIAAAIIITFNETMSKLVYSQRHYPILILSIIKYTKIGIIYGLFVEAFKLGS